MDNKTWEITVSKTCRRIEFLHDFPIVYILRCELKDHKIYKLETADYQIFDVDKWNSRRDSLTTWIDAEHPELSGFVYDLTLDGAQNYLKAIELYDALGQSSSF